MRIIDILKDEKMSLSYEVFPPKKESAYDSVKTAVEEIAKLKPSFMSVTYGAGGGTSKYTLDIAKDLKYNYGVPMLAHLTCVSSSKDTVREMIHKIKDAGIQNIMALRGDLTEELKCSDRSTWDYKHAIELVQEIKSIDPNFCIGAACYPEVHPESSCQREDIKHLKEKVDAGVDFLTTQMVFDNSLFLSFMYKIREAGITVPVLPGIMPITKAIQVKRAISLSGAFIPQKFKSIVDMFCGDDAAMMEAGISYATDQIIDLYANGITNVHVYSMNNPAVAEGISRNLTEILGKRF